MKILVVVSIKNHYKVLINFTQHDFVKNQLYVTLARFRQQLKLFVICPQDMSQFGYKVLYSYLFNLRLIYIQYICFFGKILKLKRYHMTWDTRLVRLKCITRDYFPEESNNLYTTLNVT